MAPLKRNPDRNTVTAFFNGAEGDAHIPRERARKDSMHH